MIAAGAVIDPRGKSIFVLLLLLAGTAIAMVLLVLYSRYLFEENRTRVTRARPADPSASRPAGDAAPVDDVVWRTVVDPVEAANRARASQPFAIAYSRAMAAAHEDSRAA